MSRIAYVNGRYLPHGHAGVSIDDRGYQFGDSVYEVITILEGVLADEEWHLDRLEYSLGELGIPMPMSREALKIVIKRVIEVNRLETGSIYFQVTRGVMRRDHAFSGVNLKPQLVVTANDKEFPMRGPVKVITLADIRWGRRDIKTTQLLPNCIAKTKAYEAGAYEAWMVDEEGFVTEGTSSNAWIVSKNGEIITRPKSFAILSGITRKAILALAEKRNLKVVERPFTPKEAANATEAFMTSASSLVTSIGSIDGKKVGDGEAGPVSLALRQAYFAHLGVEPS